MKRRTMACGVALGVAGLSGLLVSGFFQEPSAARVRTTAITLPSAHRYVPCLAMTSDVLVVGAAGGLMQSGDLVPQIFTRTPQGWSESTPLAAETTFSSACPVAASDGLVAYRAKTLTRGLREVYAAAPDDRSSRLVTRDAAIVSVSVDAERVAVGEALGTEVGRVFRVVATSALESSPIPLPPGSERTSFAVGLAGGVLAAAGKVGPARVYMYRESGGGAWDYVGAKGLAASAAGCEPRVAVRGETIAARMTDAWETGEIGIWEVDTSEEVVVSPGRCSEPVLFALSSPSRLVAACTGLDVVSVYDRTDGRWRRTTQVPIPAAYTAHLADIAGAGDLVAVAADGQAEVLLLHTKP